MLIVGHSKSFSGLFYVCISVWDTDLDLIIDGNLSTEISLVVLDTLAVVEQVYQKPLRDWEPPFYSDVVLLHKFKINSNFSS